MPKKETCNVDGCNAKTYRNGICATHHAKKYRVKCAVDGCQCELFAKGFCDAHYAEERRAAAEGRKPHFRPVREYRQAGKVAAKRQTKVALTRLELWVIDELIDASGQPRTKVNGREVSGLYVKLAEIATDFATRRRAALGKKLPAPVSA